MNDVRNTITIHGLTKEFALKLPDTHYIFRIINPYSNIGSKYKRKIRGTVVKP